VTLVGANKLLCHRCRLYHLTGEAKERQQAFLVSLPGGNRHKISFLHRGIIIKIR
jgi:hypothetical protein